MIYIHPTAEIDGLYDHGYLEPSIFSARSDRHAALVGDGTKIWHWVHVMSGAKIGKNCHIGQGVFIADRAVIGDGCKIQNNVSVYSGVTLGNRVLCGPSCVFTNVNRPRAAVKAEVYEETIVEDDVTIGANATIVCPVRLGEGCFIGAGAVVTKDVAPGETVVGNPARGIE